MSRRWTAGLVLGAIAAATALVLYRAPAPIGPTQVVPPWDPDVEGYDAGEPDEAKPATVDLHTRPFLNRYCIECHGGTTAKGGIRLEGPVGSGDLARAAEAVQAGRMPPPGKPRPISEELERLNTWSGQVAADSPLQPVTLRRLNRAEYNNTVRDLFNLPLTPADDFPADDTGNGFDTSGDVLSVSPTLIERYLTAADALLNAVTAAPRKWEQLRTPPPQDDVPYVLRGMPPQRDNAMKGSRGAVDGGEAARTTELERCYAALQAFADRAYRRPVTHTEMSRLMKFVEDAINRGEGAEAGFKLALKAVLVSPHFLFKVERSTPDNNRVNDFELATRLSYFLWSSIPDEELFRAASMGKLSDLRTLVVQVRRMLRDPRSQALAQNFAGQWLEIQALPNVTRDPAQFPGFDAALLTAAQKETELFFDGIVRDDRSVIDLLTGEYTFVNERLAGHYGLSGVRGEDFRRVSLRGTGRAGVLTHASVLMATSNPNRTSPVKRGKWVLENVLGMPVPSPPPGVDSLTDKPGDKPATLRERLEQHRARAECASCHARLDPIGFGLENFDAVGAWRTSDGGVSVDARGTLPDGRAFNGPAELISALAARPDDFARCLTRKLLTYGLGRDLGPRDRRAVETVVRHAARNNFRFSSLVVAIVRSEPFRQR